MEKLFKGLIWFGVIGACVAFWGGMFLGSDVLLEFALAFCVIVAACGALGLIGTRVLERPGVSEAVGRSASRVKEAGTEGGVAVARRVTRKQVLVGLAAIIVVLVGFEVKHRLEFGRAQKKLETLAVQSRCVSWIDEEFNTERYAKPAISSGVWEKNDHVVVEVAWKQRSGDSYQSRLCVYDPETGRMRSPGALGRGRWEKY